MSNEAMLTGKELGKAIEAARQMKGVTKAEFARHFGVKPPSIQDWINHGRIAKDHLTRLWEYFSDVVGPEHWGLSRDQWRDARSPDQTIPTTNQKPLSAQENTLNYGDAVDALPVHDLSIITAERIMVGDVRLDRRFAWIAEDNHMAGGDRPTPRGHHAVIDPTVHYALGDVVLARLSGRRPILRRITDGGDAEYLVTESGEVPPVRVDPNCEIIGVMITSYSPPIERPPKIQPRP